MNKLTFNNKLQSSHTVCEEFFPLRIEFDSSIGDNRFIGFYGGNSNLLEFTVSRATNEVKKLQIVTCKNYAIIDAPLEIPSSYKAGSIHLMYPQHIESEDFLVQVYNNCIRINLFSSDITHYYTQGQVFFGTDDEHGLISLIIAGLSANDISHAIYELQSE